MAKYQRRYTQSTRLPSTDGLRIATSRMEQQSAEQIKNLQQYATQAERREEKRISGAERKFSKEEIHSNKLQSLQNDIFINQDKALKVRAKSDVQAALGRAQELEKRAKLWGDFSLSLGKSLGSAAVEAYSEYRHEKMMEDYKPTDYSKEWDVYAGIAEVDLKEDFIIQSQSGNHLPEDILQTRVKITQAAPNGLATIYTQDFVTNREVIEQVIGDSKVNDKSILNEYNVKALYWKYTQDYLNSKGVPLDNKSARALFRKTASWAESKLLELKEERLFDGTEANLLVDAELLRGNLAEFDTVTDVPDKLLFDQLSANFNLSVITAQNGTVKADDGSYISGGTLSLPQAAEYVVQKFIKQNPHLTKEDVLKMLDVTRVPASKQYAYVPLEKGSKRHKKFQESEGYKQLVSEGKDPYDVREKTYKKGLPTWKQVLEERGSLDVITKEWDRVKLQEKTDKDNSAKVAVLKNIASLERRWDGGYTAPEGTDPNVLFGNSQAKIDINNPEHRAALYEMGSDDSTNESVRDKVFEKLDWDVNRTSSFAAVENYKTALDTLNYDDDAYYFSFLSDEDKKYYGARHKDMKGLRAAGITHKKSYSNLRSHISTKYGDNYDSSTPDGELDAVTEHATQRLNHYLHRLGDPDNPDYIEHPTLRYEKAEEFVHADINEGIKDNVGVFAAQPVGRGGNLRLKWKNFSPGATKTNLKDVNNALTDLLGGTYDAEKVKNVVTAKEKFLLERMVVEGNARKFPLPENVIEVKRKFPNTPLRTIINDILMETKETDNMEVMIPAKYEWPAELEEIIQSNSNTNLSYSRTPVLFTAYAQEITAITGMPPMSEKLRTFMEEIGPWQ